jgi:dsDNA-binding SOS-regulon protein
MHLLDVITAKINQILLIFTLIVLGASFYFVYSLNLSYAQKEMIQSLDTTLLLAQNLLEEEEQHALSLSLLLSQNKSFLETFFEHNRKASFLIIQQKIKSLEKLQGYRYEVQVHDQNLHTYLRSWDFNITGIPLATFRKGLVKVKADRKPLVSIEVGKRLNIKAISPILIGDKFQGSIEVIEDFGHLREKLSDQGYALFVLLDKKYLPVATSLKNQPVLSEKYLLVNMVYDQDAFLSLTNSNLLDLGSYGYLTQGKFSFGYFDIKNLENEKLGYIVIGMKNSMSLSKHAYHESEIIEQNNSGVIIR